MRVCAQQAPWGRQGPQKHESRGAFKATVSRAQYTGGPRLAGPSSGCLGSDVAAVQACSLEARDRGREEDQGVGGRPEGWGESSAMFLTRKGSKALEYLS